MQVSLQPLFKPDNEGSPVLLDTNAQATVQSLISSYCVKKGIAYNSAYVIYDEQRRPIPSYQTLQAVGISYGQTLYIGYGDERWSWKSLWPLAVAAVALVVGLIGIITMSLVYSLSGGIVPFDHAVVMDAGSSKTQTLLYEWKGDKYNGTGCVKQRDDCVVEPGIADAEDFNKTVDDILSCTGRLTKNLKPKSLRKTQLYFAATAGMRLLNLTDPWKAEDILSNLTIRLSESKLVVRNVSMIFGREEGVYAWTTVNFLKNVLSADLPDPWAPVTYGSLDMGGASTQIAFALPPTDERINSENVVNLTLFGQNHHVFSKSYECFGRTEAQNRYRYYLVKKPSEQIVSDPCAPLGFNITMSRESVFGRACAKGSQYANLLLEQPSTLAPNYTFVGNSDYEECDRLVQDFLSFDRCKELGFEICFKELPRKVENQKYVAFSAFFFTTNFLGLKNSTLQEYENTTKYFCQKKINEIKGSDKHKAEYCFNAVYIYHILVDYYKLNDTTWKNLEFHKKIDGKDLGWTLGYMINATNAIPAKKPSKRAIAPEVLTVCLVIFILAVVATIIYILHTVFRKRGENTAQQA